MGSPQRVTWSPPPFDPIPPTLLGVIGIHGLTEQILDDVLEEDIAFQVRPIYHPVNRLMTVHWPGLPPPPPRLHQPIQQGRMAKLGGNGSGLASRRAAGFQYGVSNPYLTFMEHSPWQVDDAALVIDNSIRTWAIEPPVHSNFRALRQTCRTLYAHAWRTVARRRRLIVQVVGFGIPDLRNIIPDPAGDNVLLRHPRIDDLEIRMDTLEMVPTFDNVNDYSVMIQHMPRLRWVVPGSIHIHWPDPNPSANLPVGAYFSAEYFFCGLLSRQQEALDWLISLVGHLVRPRMFVRPGQNVTVVRQISLNSVNDRTHGQPTLNMLVAYDLPHASQIPNVPYIIYAALEPSQQPDNSAPFRIMWSPWFIRREADRHIRRLNAAPPPNANSTNVHSPIDDVQLGFHVSATFHQPRHRRATIIWQTYANIMRLALMPFTVDDWAHQLMSAVEQPIYLFRRG